VKLLGGKVGRGRKEPSISPSIGHQAENLFLLLPLATKQKTFSFSFHWPPSRKPFPSPSIGHQAENLFLLLPLATKKKTFSFSFHWPPRKEPSPSLSIGHQAENLLLLLPLATKQRTFSFSFHWPPSKEPSPFPSIGHQGLDLPSPSFSFSLKGGLRWSRLFLFPGDNFNSILRILVPTSFLRRKRMMSLGSWEEERE